MKNLFLLLTVPFLLAACEGLMGSLQEDEQGQENIDLEFAAVSDYVEGATSYLFSNGYVITCSLDEKYGTDGYMIFADSLDITENTWVKENAMAMLCDENYKPVIMMDDEYSYHLTEVSDGVYDVIINDLEGNRVTGITGVSIGSIYDSRAVSKADNYTPKWWIDKSFLIYQSVQELFSTNPTKLSRASTLAGLVSNFLPDSSLNTFSNISLTLGEALKGTASGYIGLMLLTYDRLIWARDVSVEKLIGECSANIVSAVQTNPGEYNLLINFSGIGQGAVFYRVQYWNESGVVDKRYSTDIMLASNGYQELKIDFSGAGQTKGFQVIMFPDVFYDHTYLQKFYCVRSDIFYLTLRPLEIVSFERSGAYYYDSTVEVDFNYTLNVRADLQDAEDYGLFYDDGNEISYISLKDDKSLSGECYITAPEDMYDCNYSSFTAEYTGNAQIGTYMVTDGETEYYVSSVSRPELLYDRKPEMNMYDMVSQYTDLDEQVDDEEYDRIVTYEYKVMFSGCLFFEDILIIYPPGWTSQGEYLYITDRLQDEFEYSAVNNEYRTYSDLDDVLKPIYFDAVLGNGSRVELPQCIITTNTMTYFSPDRLIVTNAAVNFRKATVMANSEHAISSVGAKSSLVRPKFGKKQ